MSKFIVAVFDDEKTAYEGSRAITQLDNDGSIVVYAGAVISKDSNGTVQIEDAADEGPIGTATGMLVGSLIGALGGPVGLAVGATAGSLAGWYADLYNVGVDGEFLEDVAGALTPGKSALVAEVSEGWTTPLDSRIEDLGGTIFRRARIDVEDQQIEREIEAANQELDELEAEWDQAVGETKDKLKAKVDAGRQKVSDLQEKANNKLKSLKEEADAKISKLNKQITAANEDVKAKFEKGRDQLKADYERRSAKLSEVLKSAKKLLT